jgi:hypothetical protein
MSSIDIKILEAEIDRWISFCDKKYQENRKDLPETAARYSGGVILLEQLKDKLPHLAEQSARAAKEAS